MGLLGRYSFLYIGTCSTCASVTGIDNRYGRTSTDVSLLPKNRVNIINKLPNGASFTIHCKSKDNDLGTHVMGPGQKYEIEFSVNIFETTLFFCRVSWHGGHTEFDIYKAKRDAEDRCPRYCSWEARGDAVVGFPQEGRVPDITIPWKK